MLKYLTTISVLSCFLWMAACVTTTENSSNYSPKKQGAEQRSKTLVNIGLRYIEVGETELAMQTLKEAMSLDAKNPQVYEALALAFQKTGEYALAQRHYEHALKIDPKYTRARNNYAVFLFERGYYQASCKQLEIVVSDVYYPQRSDAFSNLGLCAKKLNNLPRAREFYQRALLLNPRQTQSLLELADLDFQANDFSSAQKNLKEFHVLVPKGTSKSLLLGYRLAKLFNQSLEAATYKAALKKLYPNSTEANLL